MPLKQAGFKYATSLHMRYFHIRLITGVSNLYTIILPWGKYKYKRIEETWHVGGTLQNYSITLFDSRWFVILIAWSIAFTKLFKLASQWLHHTNISLRYSHRTVFGILRPDLTYVTIWYHGNMQYVSKHLPRVL